MVIGLLCESGDCYELIEGKLDWFRFVGYADYSKLKDPKDVVVSASSLEQLRNVKGTTIAVVLESSLAYLADSSGIVHSLGIDFLHVWRDLDSATRWLDLLIGQIGLKRRRRAPRKAPQSEAG